MRRTLSRLALVCAMLLAAIVSAAVAQPKFPALTGRVVDEAQVLDAASEAALVQVLEELEQKSTDQLVVATVKSLGGYPIEDYGYQLGRAWGVGQKDKNNGAILIVAPNERKVRIEVGRGLEPEMTDVMSRLIIENAILPAFKRGDFAGGIRAGVRDIRDVLLGNAEAVKARSKRTPEETDWETILLLCFWLAVLAFVIWAQFQDTRRMPQGAGANRARRARRNNRGDDIVFLPPAGGSGGWSGGSGGGGGWSGGGGDFGGGGGSGSW